MSRPKLPPFTPGRPANPREFREASDPVEVALDIIRKGLPGFADKVEHVPGIDLIRVRGHITFGTMGTLDQVYAVPVDPTVNGRPMRTEAAEAFARHLVDITRRRVIELTGIEELIAEREARARELGRRDGYAEGRIAGEAQGRRDMLAEILAAKIESDDDA